ncbi:MAG: CocE/NonD family hydrolase, partial [Clostridiales Family XIII bacterium]|nr:CocE/NonD family hydrolase [Clostridiales Family XIII bacterium]
MTDKEKKEKDTERIFITREINGETWEIPFAKGNPGKSREELDALKQEIAAAGGASDAEMVLTMGFCAPYNPHTYEVEEPDIICERDVTCILRDGTRINADVYRPSNTLEKVPVICCFGPFGKNPSEGMDSWKLMGVPPKTVSTMTKFESADPGFWCRMGYAVANIDPRGVGNSEGNVYLWSSQDAEDGYDFIEWVANQAWCNGRVTMLGNSGVCMSHWRIAATQPPHLACLAAWEGQGDLYRESYFVGGIPNPDYEAHIVEALAVKNYIEDTVSMVKKYPLMNEYYKDKIVKWEKIRVPTYVTAGWVHHHLRGAFEGFRRIRSPKKWMRAHRDFEWPDGYRTSSLYDLKLFFDRYCKDIHNGWEFTPRVRMDVMDAYEFDYSPARAEDAFPLKRTDYRKLYLNAADGCAAYESFAGESEVVYDPEAETTSFNYRFEEDTEISGFMKLHLWVESRGHDNMDLFPWVIKLDAEGNYVPIHCMGAAFRGAWGYLRCCHRELDEKYASDFQPVHAHTKEERFAPGEIVPVDVEFYPHSRVWHKGEQLSVVVAGRFIKTEWFHDTDFNQVTDNGDGKHVIHTGGQ